MVTAFNMTSVCVIGGSAVLREYASRISRHVSKCHLVNILRVIDKITHPIFEIYLYSKSTLSELDNTIEFILAPTMYKYHKANFMLHEEISCDSFIDGYKQSVYMIVADRRGNIRGRIKIHLIIGDLNSPNIRHQNDLRLVRELKLLSTARLMVDSDICSAFVRGSQSGDRILGKILMTANGKKCLKRGTFDYVMRPGYFGEDIWYRLCTIRSWGLSLKNVDFDLRCTKEYMDYINDSLRYYYGPNVALEEFKKSYPLSCMVNIDAMWCNIWQYIDIRPFNVTSKLRAIDIISANIIEIWCGKHGYKAFDSYHNYSYNSLFASVHISNIVKNRRIYFLATLISKHRKNLIHLYV